MKWSCEQDDGGVVQRRNDLKSVQRTESEESGNEGAFPAPKKNSNSSLRRLCLPNQNPGFLL